MWPLVKLAEWLTDLLSPDQEEAAVSREEIAAMAEEGKKGGVVDEGESRVLKNLLRLSVLRVRDIMTPCEHIVTLPEEMKVSEVLERHPELKVSRIPLHTGGNNRCFTGYVLKDDILTHAARDEHEVPLTTLRRDLLTIPEGLPVPSVFDQMVGRREHVAIAVNDAGEMTGLITMEDMIETLLGLEIFDEGDDSERIHRRAREHWHKRAQRLGLISEVTGGKVTRGITGGEPSAMLAPGSSELALAGHSAPGSGTRNAAI
jgi:CBS domain containing-hemolysin-like protein